MAISRFGVHIKLCSGNVFFFLIFLFEPEKFEIANFRDKSDGIPRAPEKAETVRVMWLSALEEAPEEVVSKRKVEVSLLM